MVMTPAAGPQVNRQKPEELGLNSEEVASKTAAATKVLSSSQRKMGAARLLVDSLKGTGITLLGSDTELLMAVAKLVGNRLGWFSVDVAKVVCGMRKVPELAKLSKQELAAAEGEVMRGLRTQVRVIIVAQPGGATSGEEVWRDLYGSMIIWLEEVAPGASKPARTPDSTVYESKAEVVVQSKAQKGFGVKGGSTLEVRSRAAAELLLTKLNDLVVEDPDLVERKRQYRSLGFRGDWPKLQPEGWSPVAQTLERKPLQGFAAEQK